MVVFESGPRNLSALVSSYYVWLEVSLDGYESLLQKKYDLQVQTAFLIASKFCHSLPIFKGVDVRLFARQIFVTGKDTMETPINKL